MSEAGPTPRLTELFRALAALAEPPGAEQVRLAHALDLPGRPEPADYTDLFLLQLYPYASVYVGADGMLGGEARDRAAGFWRALRRVPPAEPDHLTALLALYAALAEGEEAEADPARRVLRGRGRRALVWEHLACWLPAYLDKLEEIAAPCYRRWGEVLGAALREALAEAGPPEALPVHLRAAPPLPDPREAGAAAFVNGLLAPARSGVILVRADLARAARDAGLGLRAGERRFALDALLAQDAPATLRWLAADARAWAARHLRHRAYTGCIAGFWAARAGAAAELLAQLAGEAGR